MIKVEYNNTYINLAMGLIEQKSCLSDLEALNDTRNINNVILNLKILDSHYIGISDKLQDELTVKYATISLIKNAIDLLKVPNVKTSSVRNRESSIFESHIELLNLCKFGIFCDVLLKHGIITEVKQIISNVSEVY